MQELDRIANWRWTTLLWIGALCSVVGMAALLPVGWDLAVTRQAMKDLRDGLDPYAAELARLAAMGANAHSYNVYPYPPVTLRFLHLLSFFPAIPGSALYWLIYGAGFCAQLWAGFQLALPQERRILRWAIPLFIFFPGFMPNEVILCGNIAIPIYGALLASSVPGWQKNRWGWFYAAVLAGSLFKPPFLVFLALPLLVGQAEILTSFAVAGLGLLLFAGQKFVWPTEFSEYMKVLRTESLVRYSAGHIDCFGLTAAGVLASGLRALGLPFVFPGAVFYLGYGGLLFATLFYFSRQYRWGRVRSHTWLTVLLLGTFLLSPRILQYDALPATLSMFLLVLRGWKDAVARWIVIAGFVGAAAGFAANRDDLEVAFAMWFLLVAGLLGLYGEVQLSKVSVGVHSEELQSAH